MWRAFFFAVGTMLVIVGVECLLIDTATLTPRKTEAVQVNNSWFQTAQTAQIATGRIVRPTEWIPWSFIASGAIILLYSLTLPSRWGTRSNE